MEHGTRLPIETLVDIAHDAGALVLVDAVQSVGQTSIDVHEWGADIVAAAGHKWLLGTWGAGFLYVSDDVIDTLNPRTIGYRGVITPTDETYEFEPGAQRFEIGTTNPAPYVALQTAIETLDEIGLGTAESRIQQLTTRLVNGVPDDRLLSPTSPESGLVTIDVDDPSTTVDHLKEANIIVRSLPDPDAIRASVHVFNTQEDIETLLVELKNT